MNIKYYFRNMLVATALICLCISAVLLCFKVPFKASSAKQRDSVEQLKVIKPNGYPLGMTFTDADSGWIVYAKTLWKTGNGGSDWKLLMELPSNENTLLDVKFSSLYFLNGRIGWLSLSTEVLKTTDGGISWTHLMKLDDLESVADIFFLNESNGWIVGSSFNQSQERPLLLHTTDAGQTWQRDTISRGDDLGQRYGLALYDIQFLNNEVGWISGSGHIWRTTDRGRTWKGSRIEVGDEADIRLSKLQFQDEKRGYAHCGPVRGATPHDLVKTTDGGLTWSEVEIPVPFSTVGLNDFHFLDPNHGFVIFQGLLYETNETGRRWRSVRINDAIGSGKVFFLDRENGWIVCQDGILLRTRDTGRTWTTLRVEEKQ